MADIFLSILNMSISATWLVLAVLLLRLLLKKAPKWVNVVLWGLVAVRLVCPFTVESVLSLIPSAQVFSPDIMMDRTPTVNSGIPFINDAVNPVFSESFTPEPIASANPLQIWFAVAAQFWLLGMAVMVLYTAISYLRLRSKVSTAVLLRENIFQSEHVASPFVLGVFKPRIYLPFSLERDAMQHVIAHECAHIRRKDHLWKPLGFLLLTLHWFNPILWLAYILLCRDIELACDEKVIKKLGAEQRADYSQALLSSSVSRRSIAACPLAFGEVGVKARIRSVLNYKKPAFWIIIIAVIACIAVAVCFLTDPLQNESAALYEDKMLAVEILDASSTKDGKPRWNFYEIEPFYGVTLPGANAVKLSLENIEEDSIELRFNDGPLLIDGVEVTRLPLRPGERVEAVTPTPGGCTYYTFFIIDDADVSTYPAARIRALFGILQSTPSQYSNPGAYIDAHPEEYSELLRYDDLTLRWCFSQFLQNGNADLQGALMACICQDIMENWGEAYVIDPIDKATGQVWFESFLALAQSLARQYSDDKMQLQYPGAWMVLQMAPAPNENRLEPGIYIPVECVYMSPLSSYSAANLSQDFQYTVTNKLFITQGIASSVLQVDWGWKTREEAKQDMAFMKDTFFYDLTLNDSCLYQKLDSSYHILQNGSSIYLVHKGPGTMKELVYWSIYRLEKQPDPAEQ